MLGRKSYNQDELDHAKAVISEQLTAHKALAKAGAGTSDKKVSSALEGVRRAFFNNLAFVLDRQFVHRLRPVTGKDGNPLNGVRPCWPRSSPEKTKRGRDVGMHVGFN